MLWMWYPTSHRAYYYISERSLFWWFWWQTTAKLDSWIWNNLSVFLLRFLKRFLKRKNNQQQFETTTLLRKNMARLKIFPSIKIGEGRVFVKFVSSLTFYCNNTCYCNFTEHKVNFPDVNVQTNIAQFDTQRWWIWILCMYNTFPIIRTSP